MKIELLKNWHPIGAYITSGSGEDDEPDCELVFYLYWWVVRVPCPQLITPYSERVVPNWDVATVARLGRDYYVNYTRRDYGFLFSDGGFLNVFLGRQSQDSSTEQRWGYFLPWTQWRFIRTSLYGLEGEHIFTQLASNRTLGMGGYTDLREVQDNIPKRTFMFKDFDGEQIEATTHIEEREWHFGTGSFAWLSLFRAAKVRRSLAIEFNKETGTRKGSWKGGTLGHGIDMLPGELHEAAFRRYCSEHQMSVGT